MKLLEIESRPRAELDLPNKVYIVYDENGNEVNRYPFKEVWNSSPAKRAAEQEAQTMRIALRNAKHEADKKAAEAKPLSRLEQEYMDLDAKCKKYFAVLYPKDKSPSVLDSETQELYGQQIDKWQARLTQIGDSRIIRKSVLNGTYKPAS